MIVCVRNLMSESDSRPIAFLPAIPEANGNTARNLPMRNTLIVLSVRAAGLGAAAQFGKVSALFEQLRSPYAGRAWWPLGWWGRSG